AIYSEYPPETPYSPADFPNRNRIISGLSEAVVVVEAGKKSGALITAQDALEQNRELFAVPGAPDAAQSAGTHALIKSGARLLTSLQDIFDELPRLKGAVTAKRHVNSGDMTTSERRLVELLADGPVQIDELSRRVGLGMPETMELLLALELRGVIQEIAGKRYTLCE
ncbi:MAG: DNA-processing protein DprA, partial [Candidatus Zixiibacteriota bacterium]